VPVPVRGGTTAPVEAPLAAEVGPVFFGGTFAGEDVAGAGVGAEGLTTAPGSKMPESLSALRVWTRSLVMRSWMALVVGFSG
jgi:hypothetical protein